MEAGYSLRGFASDLGLSPGHLSRVETGHESPPPASRIIQMARMLQADRDELLTAAGKLDPDLVRYICKNDRIVEFLRGARSKGFVNEQFDQLIEDLQIRGP
jgi:transcriptional regulator with XRE-family HTH domain